MVMEDRQKGKKSYRQILSHQIEINVRVKFNYISFHIGQLFYVLLPWFLAIMLVNLLKFWSLFTWSGVGDRENIISWSCEDRCECVFSPMLAMYLVDLGCLYRTKKSK